MAIIWDADAQEHVIRLGGQKVDSLQPADFNTPADDRALEATLKARTEGRMPPDIRWQAFVRIHDRAKKRYTIGLRRPDWSLPQEAVRRSLKWWEWPPKPAKLPTPGDSRIEVNHG
jgi:hypothetical protein